MWFRRREKDIRIPVYLCAPRLVCETEGCDEPAVCAIRYGADIRVYCAVDTVKTIWADQDRGRAHEVNAEAKALLDQVAI